MDVVTILIRLHIEVRGRFCTLRALSVALLAVIGLVRVARPGLRPMTGRPHPYGRDGPHGWTARPKAPVSGRIGAGRPTTFVIGRSRSATPLGGGLDDCFCLNDVRGAADGMGR